MGDEEAVGVDAKVKTAFSVTAADGTGVAVSLPVTGRRIGSEGEGTISASISLARATAVLFIFVKDRSCVLRACRSAKLGGVGLMLASTNTIHPIPEHSRSKAKA